jgi:hypothetical protein
LFYEKVHFHRKYNLIEHLLFFSREFLFLKEQILIPGSVLALCLNNRLTVHNTKHINIYASIVRSTSLHVMCVRSVASGLVLQRYMYAYVQGSSLLHVMYVRNLSVTQVP